VPLPHDAWVQAPTNVPSDVALHRALEELSLRIDQRFDSQDEQLAEILHKLRRHPSNHSNTSQANSDPRLSVCTASAPPRCMMLDPEEQVSSGGKFHSHSRMQHRLGHVSTASGLVTVSDVMQALSDTPSKKPCGRSEGRESNPTDECWVDGENIVMTAIRRFSEFVESQTFDYIMGLIIVLNTIFLGIQLDYIAREKVKRLTEAEIEEPKVILIIESLFASTFFLELVARILAVRTRFPYSGWNIFDAVVVAASVVEEGLKYGIGGDTIAGKLSALRIIKVFKLVRTLRIIRVFRAFRELRITMMSMVNCMRQLLWTLFLLSVMMYVMAVLILVEVTSKSMPYAGNVSADVRLQFFSNLPRSLLTVYQCTTFGIQWETISTALSQIIPWIDLVWAAYIAFAIFAFGNTITGIFVDQSLKASQDDARNVLLEELEQREAVVASFRQIFHRIDPEEKATISRKTLLKFLADSEAKVQLKRFDIDARDIITFFDLVSSVDRTIHYKDMEEFVNMSFRLKGVARSVDILALDFKYRKIVDVLKTTERKAIDERPTGIKPSGTLQPKGLA